MVYQLLGFGLNFIGELIKRRIENEKQIQSGNSIQAFTSLVKGSVRRSKVVKESGRHYQAHVQGFCFICEGL